MFFSKKKLFFNEIICLSYALIKAYIKSTLAKLPFSCSNKYREKLFSKTKGISIMKKRSKHISKKGSQADSAEPPKRNFCFNSTFNEDCVALKEV